MSQNPAFDKLLRLLKELFQLDQPDLDFGLYRIMHARAEEITQFLDRDLLPQVKDAFGQYRTADKAEMDKELQELIAGIEKAGMNPEESPKVQELRQKVTEQGVDVAGLEQEVYDHLYKFFRRYYHEGDFLAKRVYKPGVYAIPYEGEEVKLHWANKDQYYIKTSEHLRDYGFTLRPGADDPMRVHFRLADAAEGEHGNVKEAEDRNRVFILAGKDFMAEQDGESGKELVIRFEYRPAIMADWSEGTKADATAAAKKKPPIQKNLRADAVRRILAVDDENLKPWLAELAKSHIKADGDPAGYSRVAAHLNRYTARNTFDYFIHKDLGGFLRRELDFYIKNEVMHLDDIESETGPRVEQYLSKIKVIRQIAGKIIDFLAQLENFQKKLWLKKKFVTETSWCIRVGCIPEEFYPVIAANEGQRKEWVSLHAIDKIERDLTTVTYSEPLTSDFLKGHPTLMVDTRHFDEVTMQRLLEAMGDISGQTDGVLFNSENLQSLAVASTKYFGTVHVAYIDPPYNTELDRQTGKFIYKDNYASSTWASLMADRIKSGSSLLREDGAFICSIDDNEYPALRELLNSVYGSDNFIGTIAWKSRDSVSSDHKISLNHNYHVVYAKDLIANKFGGFSLSPGDYSNPDKDPRGPWKPVPIDANKPGGDTKYPIENPNTGVEHYPPSDRIWAFNRSRYDELFADNRISFGIRGTGAPKRKLYLRERTEKGDVNTPVSIWTDAETTQTGTRQVMNLFGNKAFPYPKPVGLMRDLIRISHLDSNCIVVDYFAGSGTTGHAVVNLNRTDDGGRKFILMEMGDNFDAVLLPRLKKVTFTPEWSDGKPMRLATEEEADRSPRVLKVVRLESYEDALNNLELRRTKTQGALLESAEAQSPDGLREQYLLRYMLDVETRSSQSLLNIDAFSDPTAYRLKVKRPGSEETRETRVDLLETFNWLIGLTVETMAAPQTVSAAFKRDDDPDLPEENPRRLLLDGRLREDTDGHWWFRTVTGITPEGSKTLVIWRKLTGDNEQDNLVLDAWFQKQGYSSKDSEFDLIYVNGDNNLENLRQPDDTWKVRLIEEDFHRLMFEETEA